VAEVEWRTSSIIREYLEVEASSEAAILRAVGSTCPRSSFLMTINKSPISIRSNEFHVDGEP